MKGDARRNDAQTTRRASYPPRFDPHLRRRRKYLLGSGGLRMRAKGVKDLILCTGQRKYCFKVDTRARRRDSEDCFAAYVRKLNTEAARG